MIAIYSRVASNPRDSASQADQLTTWAVGKENVTQYEDQVTGTTLDYPEFERLLEDCRIGTIHTVVVWRIDCLARTVVGLHKMLELFQSQTVNLVSLQEGLNLETPCGRMLAGVIASLATFETEVRSERTAASLEAKKLRVAEGRETWNVGRPVGAVHKLTPEVREKLYQMADEGTKKSEIAEVLKLSRQSVYRALKLRPD